MIMNTLPQNEKITIQKLMCSFFGHKLVIKRAITNNFYEFECTVCHEELTHDEKGCKTSLTPHLREVNETLFHFHNRRSNYLVHNTLYSNTKIAS